MKYKHLVIPKFGGTENLLVAEDELLEPRANEVRVKVLAAGVSFADILMREGVTIRNLGILEEHHLLQDGMLLVLLIN